MEVLPTIGASDIELQVFSGPDVALHLSGGEDLVQQLVLMFEEGVLGWIVCGREDPFFDTHHATENTHAFRCKARTSVRLEENRDTQERIPPVVDGHGGIPSRVSVNHDEHGESRAGAHDGEDVRHLGERREVSLQDIMIDEDNH